MNYILRTDLQSVRAFAPATVANVSCGFDIMGFAIEGSGDEVSLTPSAENKITMSGPYGHLIPAAMEKNTAGVALLSFLQAIGQPQQGFHIELKKNMPLGSGMGSSASSSAAVVFAANYFYNTPFSTSELIPFAMEGERLASGTAHADNVAPSLLGGFVLIRNYQPLDICRVPCSNDLYCSVVHPHIELHTSDARKVLRREIPLNQVIRQTANTAGFMLGLLQNDHALMGRSMHDLLAEPLREQLIPGFKEARLAAMEAGAIGCGISGSGPSVFALSNGLNRARDLATVIRQAFLKAGLDSESFVSGMNVPGARILNNE